MSLWSSDEIYSALALEQSTHWNATGVSIDTRTLQEGDLFIALDGEFCDGHDYLEQAVSRGAVAVVVHKAVAIEGVDVIHVGDTQEALVQLACYRRAQASGRIIGITGSVGKTSTKEMSARVFAEYGSVYATKGNLNNHIGLPLSLSRMPRETEYGIFELGMNHAGEIRALTHILQPHIAVISNVSSVHIEHFDSEEAIAAAKAEIMEGVLAQGVVILPHENRHYDALRAYAAVANLEVVSFGYDAHADIQCQSYHATDNGLLADIRVKSSEVHCNLPSWSQPTIEHAMISLALVKELNLSLEKAIKAMHTMSLTPGRGAVINIKSWRIMDDSYNASPASVAAALQTLSQYQKMVSPQSRKVAILGDMLELGAQSITLHEQLIEAVIASGVECLFTVGESMKYLFALVPENIRAMHFSSSENIASSIENQLEDEDIILIKGSRGIKMERIIAQLQEN